MVLPRQRRLVAYDSEGDARCVRKPSARPDCPGNRNALAVVSRILSNFPMESGSAHDPGGRVSSVMGFPAKEELLV